MGSLTYADGMLYALSERRDASGWSQPCRPGTKWSAASRRRRARKGRHGLIPSSAAAASTFATATGSTPTTCPQNDAAESLESETNDAESSFDVVAGQCRSVDDADG